MLLLKLISDLKRKVKSDYIICIDILKLEAYTYRNLNYDISHISLKRYVIL